MTRFRDLHEKWMENPEYRAEYRASKPRFELMTALTDARMNAGLTQQELAERMGTTQSAVARLEGWTTNPSVNTLRKFAEATGTRLKISFEPIGVVESANGEDEGRNAGYVADGESIETGKLNRHLFLLEEIGDPNAMIHPTGSTRHRRIIQRRQFTIE